MVQLNNRTELEVHKVVPRKPAAPEEVLGVVRNVSDRGDYCFLSAPKEREASGRVFLHFRDAVGAAAVDFRVCGWIAYKIRPSQRKPGNVEAFDARPVDAPTIEELVQRLEGQYGSTCSDPASFRLDGLTRDEAKKLHNKREMPDLEYYASMSQNGLKGMLGQSGVASGSAAGRAELVAAAMESIRRKA